MGQCARYRFGRSGGRRVLLATLAIALLPPSARGRAEWPALPPSLQVHGFASQAYVLTSDNDFFGESETGDGGSFGFRELGLNASWQPITSLRFSVQGVSRWAGEGDRGEPRIDYAFLDWSFFSDEEDLWGVRVGRAMLPYGLYNDTRDVAHTRPSIFLPQSIYFDRVRDVALSGDGAHFYAERRTSLGDFTGQFALSRARVEDRETELSLLGAERPGELESENSYIGRLLYETTDRSVRASAMGAIVNISYEPGRPVPADLPEGRVIFRPWIFSLQCNQGPVSVTGEYAIRGLHLDLGPIQQRVTGESYYLQAAYRFAEAWEAMARYDVLYTDRHDRDGKDFEAQTRGAVPAHTRYAKDLTTGLRWDITPSWMARVEYHLVDGTAWLPRLDNEDVGELKRHWQLFSALLSFRF